MAVSLGERITEERMIYLKNSKQFTKRYIKRALQKSLSRDIPPIIIASMGRSGSTLVFSAVSNAIASYNFSHFFTIPGRKIVSDYAFDLSNVEFLPSVVYKTHGLASELSENSRVKVIFLFSSATDAALSVLSCRDRYGPHWIESHFAHMRAKGDFQELASWDVLRFGEQIDGWVGKRGVERLIIHYEELWNYQDTLSSFVGTQIRLPPRRSRSSANTVSPETRARFEKTYAELDARIQAMPPCQVLY